MLERTEYMPLGYFQKQRWSGSYQGMRFLFQKQTEPEPADGDGDAGETDWLEVVVWREPYSYEATAEERKTRRRFAMTEEGREAAIDWLEQEYESRKPEWQQARNWDWDA